MDWTDLKDKLRDYTFKSYGVACEEGKIYPKRKYIREMLDSSFVFQSKGPWEGYGHTLHNAMCLGRPLIIKADDYRDKLAEPLLIKDETYLEMDDSLPEKIKFFSNPERLRAMSANCERLFHQYIDFDQEFLQIKKFLSELI